VVSAAIRRRVREHHGSLLSARLMADRRDAVEDPGRWTELHEELAGGMAGTGPPPILRATKTQAMPMVSRCRRIMLGLSPEPLVRPSSNEARHQPV
jgi:hypothetical protein